MFGPKDNDISTVNSATYVVHELSPEEIRKAQMLAARYAVDAAEAREFLDALGLLEKTP